MKEFFVLVALWACVQAKLVRIPLETYPSSELIEVHPRSHELLDIKDEIYARISIGNPPQTFLMGFDSHYADMRVSSSKCTGTTTFCQKYHKYDSDKSTTYIANGTAFKLFGLGVEPFGFLSTDEVAINGLRIENQTFAEITRDTSYYTEVDGYVGLAYPVQSWTKTVPLLDQMLEQKLIDALIFSFHFVSGDGDIGSELVLGGVDPNHYEGEITYVPVIGKTAWIVQMDSLTVGDDNNKTTVCGDRHSIKLKTNSGDIRGPEDEIQKLHEAIGAVPDPSSNNGFYIVDCSNIASLPDVTFTFGGKDFSLTSEEYVFKSNLTGDHRCFSRFLGGSIDNWKLGSVFMRKYLTVFDRQNDRVGFAKSV